MAKKAMTSRVVASVADAPWYVRLIAREGVAVAIAAYLVYWLTTTVSGGLTRILTAQGEILQVQITTCKEIAKSDAGKLACQTIQRDPHDGR
jgi:hypothetical protein